MITPFSGSPGYTRGLVPSPWDFRGCQRGKLLPPRTALAGDSFPGSVQHSGALMGLLPGRDPTALTHAK